MGTGSARKKAKLDLKPKVSKDETKSKSNDATVAKPENEPSIQDVKNGDAKKEVVIDQEEAEHKPDDNVDLSDASKHEPTGVDAELTPKVKVSTPKETPRIENTLFKTPEAKSRSAKDNNLTSPMEKNLSSSLEKKLTPKQLARKDMLDKARQEKEKQEEEAQKEQEQLEREKKKKEELDEKERLKNEKEAQKEQERSERET